MGIFYISSAEASNLILWGVKANIPPTIVCSVIESFSGGYFELLRKRGKKPVPGKDCFSYNLRKVARSSEKYFPPEALEWLGLYDLP